MTRKEARSILGNQPKWALRNMARALQTLTRLNNRGDWRRLEALRALGHRVTVAIPGGDKEVAAEIKASKAQGRASTTGAYLLTPAPDLRAMGHACAAEYIARHGIPRRAV